MRAVEKAWAAGFLDGEGCFTLTRSTNKRTVNARIHAGQIVRDPLDKLQGLFGGNVSLRDTRNRPFWLWELYGASACRTVLPQLIPYLVVKRAQAELLLEFCERINPRAGGTPLTELELAVREEYAYALAEMKH